MKSIDARDSSLDQPTVKMRDRHVNKYWLFAIAIIATGGAIALTSVVQAQQTKPATSTPCANIPNTMPMSMQPIQGMSNYRMMMTGEVADRHFIEMMIPHHEGAVKMADLVLKRSQNPEIRQLAESIKRDQTREIEQMKAWYKQWYKADVPDLNRPMIANRENMGMRGNMRMTGMINMMTTDLKILETAKDSDFDKVFLAEMIPHHKMALMMSNMIVDSDRPEMRQLARNILRSQSQEIDQMQGWAINLR